MKCRNCGREINDTSAFCGYCNAIVKPEQRKMAVQQPPAPRPVMTPPPVNNQPEDSTPVYRKWWFWTAISVLLILIVGIVFFGLFGNDKNDGDKETEAPATAVAVEQELTKPTAPLSVDEPEVLTEVASMIHDGSFDNFEGNVNTPESNSSPYTMLVFDQATSVPGLMDFSIGTVFTTQELYNHNETIDENSPFPDIEGETYIFVGGTMRNTSDEEIMPTFMHLDFILNGVSVKDAYFSEIYLSDAGQTRYYDVEYLAPGETRYFLLMTSVPDEVFEQITNCEVIFGFDSELSSQPYYGGIDYCDYVYYIRTDEFETM